MIMQDIQQVAYKPIEIQNGIWIADDVVDHKSAETIVKFYNNESLPFYEIAGGLIEKTVYNGIEPICKDIEYATGTVAERFTYKYDDDSILKNLYRSTSADNYQKQSIHKCYSYKNEVVNCTHLKSGLIMEYERTTTIGNKTIVERFNNHMKPLEKNEFHYFNDRLEMEVKTTFYPFKSRSYFKYSYNKDGLRTTTEWSDTENKVITCRFYEYDTFKNCIKEELFHLGLGTTIQEIKSLYEYTHNGNWARKTIYINGNIKYFVDNKRVKKGIF